MDTCAALTILGTQYLHAADLLLEGLINQGNQFMTLGKVMAKIEDNQKKYLEETKYSDFRMITPALFNCYHGLELMLKGLISIKKGDALRTDHNIEVIYNEFKSHYPENSYAEKFIFFNKIPPLLRSFLKENNLSSVQGMYQRLRYPIDTINGNTTTYLPLHHQSSNGVEFAKELRENLDSLTKNLVELYRKTRSS